MKLNQWTLGLAAAGIVSLASAVQAEEAQHQVLTAVSSTTLSGYVDTSAIYKFGTGNALMPGRAFDGAGKMDGFNLNAVNVTVEKGLDEGQWSAGYKAELIFGPDAAIYDSTAQNIKQAYAVMRAPVGNGLDIKMGVWDTPVGFEAFNAAANPNYSRSYGWQLEPTQHTGILASYQVNDVISFSAGVANTLLNVPGFSGINVRSPRGETHKSYLASITLTAPESAGFVKGGTLTAGIVDGFGGSVANDTTLLYVGGTLPTPIEGVSLGIAFDYLFDNGLNGLTPATTAGGNWAWAAAGYISWQATEKLKVNGRLDYVTGSDGTFYDAGLPGSTKANELISPTVTLDYALWENVITRAEVRWDHSLSSDKIFGSAADPDKNATTLALNVIYKF